MQPRAENNTTHPHGRIPCFIFLYICSVDQRAVAFDARDFSLGLLSSLSRCGRESCVQRLATAVSELREASQVAWSVTQPMPKDARRGGRLLLVDCAGTERKCAGRRIRPPPPTACVGGRGALAEGLATCGGDAAPPNLPTCTRYRGSYGHFCFVLLYTLTCFLIYVQT